MDLGDQAERWKYHKSTEWPQNHLNATKVTHIHPLVAMCPNFEPVSLYDWPVFQNVSNFYFHIVHNVKYAAIFFFSL